MKYKKGTQEMLDAAKDDAMLLPFDTVFVTQLTKDVPSGMPAGITVVRGATGPGKGDYSGNRGCVAFMSPDLCDYWYVDSNDLLPAKKSKPKKWQNGTQAQLDAAKDDARLIPKKTYFMSRYGDTKGQVVYRVDSKANGIVHVLMVSKNHELLDFNNASRLEPIND